MRGIIYCVHLFGVGHLKRMLTLAKGLVEEGHAITLIQAGRAEDETFFHPKFKHLLLPLYKGFFLQKQGGSCDRTSLFKEHMKFRRKKLFSMLDFSRPYDFLITEQIPFSKIAFLYEAYSIMGAARAMNPRFSMICSQKGGTPPQTADGRAEVLHKHSMDILEQLKQNYDKVLVHCDPQVSTLEEMFSYCEEIRDKIVYTGYIFPRSEKYPPSDRRQKTILVTNGSGDKGMECLKVAAAIVPLLPEYRFIFIASPLMPSGLVDFLREASEKNSNMQVIGFLENLDEKLRECALAITLAGSTLINLYATGTPALVYPDPYDSGQVLLGSTFEKLGLVRLIRQRDLSPKALRNLVADALSHPLQSQVELNIAGVKNSIQAIRECVEA